MIKTQAEIQNECIISHFIFRNHKLNKSHQLDSKCTNILKDIEEDKNESIDFDIQKQRRERIRVELQVKKIAVEMPELLDEKTKEIIKRIDTKNLK